jgi:hypothetical protein
MHLPPDSMKGRPAKPEAYNTADSRESIKPEAYIGEFKSFTGNLSWSYH